MGVYWIYVSDFVNSIFIESSLDWFELSSQWKTLFHKFSHEISRTLPSLKIKPKVLCPIRVENLHVCYVNFV